MFDQIEDTDFEHLNTTTALDPRELYRSQLFPYRKNALSKFIKSGQVIDLDTAIDKFIVLATSGVLVAKERCSDPTARDFIFRYVRYFMEDDLFVARMRVGMLQHIVVQTHTFPNQPSFIERALGNSGGDRHAKEVQNACNTADHHAVRLQMIRAKVNEAVLRVVSDHMVIDAS
jgi:hypothetical protein